MIFELNNIDLIIYDLDGVLIDSRKAICKTFNTVLKEIGEKEIPDCEINNMIGEPLVEMFKKAIPASKYHLLGFAYDKYVEVYRKNALKSTRLLPGVQETLSYFTDNGLKQSLATTKRSNVACYLLKHLKVRQYFDLLLGVNDVANPKPSPEIINLTLNKLSVNKEKTIFVEDTTIGLEAGRKAEVKTIGITTGTHSKEQLRKYNPYQIINNIKELMTIVKVKK